MRNLANNFTRLREVNAELVRGVLKTADSVTKAALATATGLSVATCGNIIAEMLERGEVLELDLGIPEGGRPPRLYTYDPLYSLTALIFPKAEAGEKHIHYAVVDARGGMLERDSLAVNRAGLDDIDRLIGRLRKSYANLKALALAIPGLVRNGRVGFCDVPELEGVDVERYLHDEHGLPLSVDNDMNLAAYGYYHRHLGPGEGSVVYLVVPSKNCTGAGLVVDGKLIRGHSSFAGELSFIPFGVSRQRQFAGLGPKEALDYTAKVAAGVIPVINPSTLVVASELLDAKALAHLRRSCLQHIPEEHMPELVSRRSIDDDCLAGLAIMADSTLAGKVRLVEEVAR